MNTTFWPIQSQISPKWDKSVTFSGQISVHFGLVKNYPDLSHLETIWNTLWRSLTSLITLSVFIKEDDADDADCYK